MEGTRFAAVGTPRYVRVAYVHGSAVSVFLSWILVLVVVRTTQRGSKCEVPSARNGPKAPSARFHCLDAAHHVAWIQNTENALFIACPPLTTATVAIMIEDFPT